MQIHSLPANADNAPAVDKAGHRVRDMFGQIAGKYDLMNHLLSLNVDRYWRWQTVRCAPPQGPDPILDLCTGTGDLAFAYWRASKGGIPIIGADFCREMLELADQKKGRAGAANDLDFLEVDAMEMPFASDSFQIVSVGFGLRNIEDTDRGLREMVRVCRPGGRVVVLEFSIPTIQPIKSVYGFYFRHILPRIGQRLARNNQSAYEYLPSSVGHFDQGRELTKRMQAAGLRKTSFRPLTMGVATVYIGTK